MVFQKATELPLDEAPENYSIVGENIRNAI